jgi:hypothetical protein
MRSGRVDRGVRERKGSNIKSNNALINPQSRLMFSGRGQSKPKQEEREREREKFY